MKKTIGVLALQGGVAEHLQKIEAMGAQKKEVRFPSDLEGIDGIILPGGETTCIGKLLIENGLAEPLRKMLEEGLPVWGTCAGAILLAKEIDGKKNNSPIGLMDIGVKRNAYGKQLDSFIETIPSIPLISSQPISLIFIRAPRFVRLGKTVEPLVEISTAQGGREIVAAQKNNFLATAFHPELGNGTAFHEYFLHHFIR